LIYKEIGVFIMAKRILVTGAFGQIGSELVPALQQKHGKQNVIALGHRNIPDDFDGIVEKGDVTDKGILLELVKKHDVGIIYHLASILSAAGEKKPELTWKVNMGGLKNVLELAAEHKLRVFWPSSIAVYGPTTPGKNTPQRTILEPTTMYGVTKLAGELLCQYYFLKFMVDVRSIRYPGIISYKTPPGGGTSDYAVTIFYEALKKKRYECFVRADTTIPMMYMGDAINATIMLMDADPENITVRTSYNLAAVSFSAGELADEIKKYIPDLVVTYKPDERQKIADSWADSIDDSVARKDWGWKHEFELAKITEVMLKGLRKTMEVD